MTKHRHRNFPRCDLPLAIIEKYLDGSVVVVVVVLDGDDSDCGCCCYHHALSHWVAAAAAADGFDHSVPGQLDLIECCRWYYVCCSLGMYQQMYS